MEWSPMVVVAVIIALPLALFLGMVAIPLVIGVAAIVVGVIILPFELAWKGIQKWRGK